MSPNKEMEVIFVQVGGMHQPSRLPSLTRGQAGCAVLDTWTCVPPDLIYGFKCAERNHGAAAQSTAVFALEEPPVANGIGAGFTTDWDDPRSTEQQQYHALLTKSRRTNFNQYNISTQDTTGKQGLSVICRPSAVRGAAAQLACQLLF